MAVVNELGRSRARIIDSPPVASNTQPSQGPNVVRPGGGPVAGEKVHCLRFTFPVPNDLPDISQTEITLRRLNARYSQPHRSFGLDHRTQYLIEEENEVSLSRKPFYRLSQEPLIFSNWARISALNFTPETAAAFASLLCSKEVAIRNHPMWARGPVGNFVYFDDMNAMQTWLSDLERLRVMALPALTEAMISYCRIVIAHPFTDGNGRFARAMFYGPLARAGVLSSPCLALGTTLNLKREEIAQATIRFGNSGDWASYINAIAIAIEFAAQLVLRDS